MAKETTPSVEEVKKRHESDQKHLQTFETVRNTIKTRNLISDERRSYGIYNKDRLRRFLKNPYQYYGELIGISQYLYRLSYQYRRTVWYFASMVDMTAYTAIPKVEKGQGEAADKKTMKDFEAVLMQLQKMNLKMQMLKFLITAWREDVAYGYVYEDSTGFFIMPLDGRYCKISSQNLDGTYNFAFDFSYFTNHLPLLEYWDEEFTRLYAIYKKDQTKRWHELDPRKTFCIKINTDDLLMPIPPFLPLFEQIIDLIDLQSIQAVKDALSAYKLIYAEAQTLDKATEPDQWKVDLDTAIEFYEKMAGSLPEEVQSAISLLPLKTIDFKGTTTEDADMISNSMSNLFKASSTSQILDRAKIEGAVPYTAAMISDTVYGLSSLLPQIEAWVNRYILYRIPKARTKIQYIPVSPYTKQNYLDNALKSAEYGVPVKLQVASLLGLDPLDAYRMQMTENLMGLPGEWKPLISSHTQGKIDLTGNSEEGSDA